MSSNIVKTAGIFHFTKSQSQEPVKFNKNLHGIKDVLSKCNKSISFHNVIISVWDKKNNLTMLYRRNTSEDLISQKFYKTGNKISKLNVQHLMKTIFE